MMGERPDTGECPLCGRVAEPDFHHWDYETDVGVDLCRDCHDDLHDGLRQSHQDDKANYYGYDGWLDRAVQNLIERDLSYTPAHEFDVEQQSWDAYWNRLTERYNIPTDSVDLDPRDTVFSHVKHGGVKQGVPLVFGNQGSPRSTLDEYLRRDLSLDGTAVGPLSDRSRETVRAFVQRAGEAVTVDDVHAHFPFLEDSDRVNHWIARLIGGLYPRGDGP